MEVVDFSPLKFRLGVHAEVLASPKLNGLSRHTVNLLETVHRLAPKVEIFLYASRELSPTLLRRLPFVKTRVLNLRPEFFWEQFVLPAQLAFDSIDVFHAPANFGVPFFRPFFTGTVQTVHDILGHARARKFDVRSWRELLRFWPRWWAAASADRLLTVSESAREEIAASYPQLVKKLSVAANGVDPIFSPGEADGEVLARFGLGESYFLYVGSYEEHKNVATLVRAYRELRDRAGISTPLLALVGAEGNLRGELRALVDNSPGVSVFAYCPDEILLQLLRGAICLVAPSRAEGFGFVGLEASRVGLPVLFSDIATHREVAGELAAYFPLNDPNALSYEMERLWQDENARIQAQERARQIARRFDWDLAARKTLQAYLRAGE